MHADAEFWISFFISLASGCDGFQKVGLLLFEIFQNPFEKFARDLPVGDFLPNNFHIVQNRRLGVSEQGQIRVVWEKEPLGFPTGLARDHHAPRWIITREFLLFKASCLLRNSNHFPSFSPPSSLKTLHSSPF